MFIWEIELEKFPWGWEQLYNKAKQERPLGVYVKNKEGKVSFSQELQKGWTQYDPVEYLKRLQRKYREISMEIKKLMREETIDVSRVFTLEFLMWGIVWDYTHEPYETEEDFSMYDPKMLQTEMSLWEQYEDYEDYFYYDYVEVAGERIEKFIKVDLKQSQRETKYIPHSPNISLGE